MDPIPFAAFEPDRSKYALMASTAIVNCLPVADGWGPFPGLVVISEALPSACLGIVLVRTSAGGFAIYAGTTTHLYKLDTTSSPYAWDDVSGDTYAVPDGDRWSFAVYGSRLIATNLVDGMLYIDIDVGTEFAALPNAPKARYVWVAGDFLVGGHIASHPRRVIWSAINNSELWTPGSRGSGLQDMLSGNEVVGGIGSEMGAVIFQRNAIQVMEKTVNPDSAFSFRPVNEARGVISPLSIVQFGSGKFGYLSEDGFFVGVEGLPIGAERVDRWFLNDEIDRDAISDVRGMADPYNKIIWWQYTKTSGEKALVGWSWQLDRWCYCSESLAEISALASPSLTWDGLDLLFDSIDDVDVPFDSRFFSGGRPTLNGFTSDHKLAVFSGTPTRATVTTADIQFFPAHSTPHEMRIVTDAASYSTTQIMSKFHGGPRTRGTAVSPFSRTGVTHFRQSAFIHAFETVIPAGTDWNFITTIVPVRVTQDGVV